MPTTLVYALIMLGVQLLWCVVWALAVLGVATNDSQDTIRHDGTTYSLDDCSSYTYHSSITVGDTTLDCSRGSCHACVCEHGGDAAVEIGRASCRARVSQYVSILVVAGVLKKKKKKHNTNINVK